VTVPLKPKVLVADDHGMVRRGLRLILDGEPDFEVVAEAADGADAVELCLRTTSTWRCSTWRCRA
jgi:YesN/AraC family two-component response regulator